MVRPESFQREPAVPHGQTSTLAPPSPEVEGELARAWSEAARAVHESGAAHAEFAVQLLRLSAPAPLLHATARALLDTSALADAYADLATRHGAPRVHLAPLPRRQGADETDLSCVVIATVRRGCIDATLDSIAAREALEHCQDGDTREVLLQRHAVEARAAQLAWRFVRWALSEANRDLVDRVRVTILTALQARPGAGPLTPAERQLLRHGVLGAERRSALEQRVLRDVVIPCMEATLSQAEAARSGAA